MKNVLQIIVLMALSFNCVAQIESIETFNGQGVAGKYYKDLNNVFSTFEGTYLYTDGIKSLKIVLMKKTHSSMGDVYHEDLLVGEYEYKENNVVIVSTLNKLNENYSNGGKHSISGKGILIGNIRNCGDCLPTEKRVVCYLLENISDNIAMLIIRKINVGSNSAIKLILAWETFARPKNTIQNYISPFPSGEYILIKQ